MLSQKRYNIQMNTKKNKNSVKTPSVPMLSYSTKDISVKTKFQSVCSRVCFAFFEVLLK